MSAHTPGPWLVEFYPDGGYDCMSSAYKVTPVHGLPLALLDTQYYRPGEDVWETRHLPHATAEANARLMAAAPDLLAALEEIAGFLQPGRLLNIAHAALAKARGAA